MNSIGYEKEKPYPPEKYVRVKYEDLRNFVKEVFVKLGVREDYAEITSDVIVTADLFGSSGHGVQRIRRYVDGIRTGYIQPNNEPQVVSEVGATAVVDGRSGLGQVVGVKAMDLAVEKAGVYGASIVLVRNSNHYGIAGYYALRAVEKGYIGVSMTNSRPLVSYTNTLGRVIGTNPLAIGIPRKNPPPILFDAATSIVPVARIEYYSKIGKSVPEGWVIGIDGETVSGDPRYVLEKISRGEASLLPLGGLGELYGGHKGSSLSFLIDVFSGVLSGAGFGINVGRSNVGHVFIAIDIDCFMDKEVFYERLEEYIQMIKSSKKQHGVEEIWIPGEKSWRTMETRLKIGIPLHLEVYRDLNDLGREVGVDMELEPISSP